MKNNDVVNIQLTVEDFLLLIGHLEGYELKVEEKLKLLCTLDNYIDEVY